MAVDRLQRVVRILGPEEKGMVVPTPDGVHVHAQVGGVVLNHLGWAAALGLPTGIFGKQADDEGGRFLRDAMDRHGIARQIVCDGSASTVADIFIDPEGGRAIYMAPGATAETSAEHIRTHHADWIRAAARVTTEVSQLPLAAVRAVQAIAGEAGVPTVLDLDVPPSDALPGLGTADELDAAIRAATLLKPAKAAARELVPDAGTDALAVATALRARFGNDAVVVTDGEAGCAIAAEGVALRVPAAVAKEVVDTTGAGDAFLGALLVALAHGLSWEDAGRFANAAGAACVEKLGAFPDDPAAARTRVAELYDGAPIPFDEAAPHLAGQDPSPGAEALATLDTALRELAALNARANRRRIRCRGRADPRGAGLRCARARDRRRQARARRPLCGGPALVDRDARDLPARDRGDPRKCRSGRRRRRRARDQQQRDDRGAPRVRRRAARRRRDVHRDHRRSGVTARRARARRARRGRRRGRRRPRARAARQHRRRSPGARGAVGRARTGRRLDPRGLPPAPPGRRARSSLAPRVKRAPYSLTLTVSTGHGAFCTTRSAIEPSSRCLRPVWPRQPITIRSAFCVTASSSITVAG